jgi:hypothetical protein
MVKGKVPTGIDSEIDEIAQKIILQLETASSKDLLDASEAAKILHLTDVHHTKKLLQHMDQVSSRAERNIGKKAVIKALLLSTWLQRLYFIVRSFIMGLIGGAITFTFILYFGSINVSMGFIHGIIAFVSSLVISRLFDVQIVKATKKIIGLLDNHRTLRNFIINHF